MNKVNKSLINNIGFKHFFNTTYKYKTFTITYSHSRKIDLFNKVFELTIDSNKRLDYDCIGGSSGDGMVTTWIYSIYMTSNKNNFYSFLKKYFQKEIKQTRINQLKQIISNE